MIALFAGVGLRVRRSHSRVFRIEGRDSRQGRDDQPGDSCLDGSSICSMLGSSFDTISSRVIVLFKSHRIPISPRAHIPILRQTYHIVSSFTHSTSHYTFYSPQNTLLSSAWSVLALLGPLRPPHPPIRLSPPKEAHRPRPRHQKASQSEVSSSKKRAKINVAVIVASERECDTSVEETLSPPLPSSRALERKIAHLRRRIHESRW